MEGKFMMYSTDELTSLLPYEKGDKISFESPDSRENYIGTIEKIVIVIEEEVFIDYYVNVEDDGTVGKYYGTHIITDEWINHKIEDNL
jgi:hypothetical protein